MGEVSERLFPSMAALAPILAREIADRLAAGVKARGAASLIATGGTTPGPLYDALAQADLPWERVSITLSDERWVSPDDPASNERLVRERLLQGPAARARLVPLKTGASDPAAAEAEVGQALAALPRPFNAAVLGMGADGHVASLFPKDAATLSALDFAEPRFACAVDRPGAAGAHRRLSLSFHALRQAAWTAILITGADKLAVARRAAVGGDVAELPVRGVLSGPGPVEFWWSEAK
ncbi:MAG: 6-phosphogluconolactonase [Caulobacteraceae bacterium]|nr:6-phosphogluconolactonase [Caulobacteraceae bacterium]